MKTHSLWGSLSSSMLDSYVDSDHCLPSLLYPADDGWRSNQEDENDDFQSSGHMRAPTMTTTVLRDSQSCSTLDSIDMNIDPVLLEPTMPLFVETNPSASAREVRRDALSAARARDGAGVVATLINLPRRTLIPNFSGCD
jgi:hypothetical protein